MDHTHNGGDMSLYVPRKRKSHQSQAKCGVPCPVVQRMPERACELSVIGQHKNDESQAHDSIRMKRTYGRKRYEDLQSVPIGTVEYPTSSCAVMSSGGLANGADPGSLAPPTARLPPRLVLKKDVWPPGPECGPDRAQAQEQPWSIERGPQPTWAAAGRDRPQEQVWNSGSRDRGAHLGPDQTWAPGRDRAHNGPEQTWGATGRDQGPEQAWGSGRERAQEQAWNPGRDPGRERGPPAPEKGWNTGRSQDQVWSGTRRDGGQEPVWRPDLALKKAQRLSRNPPVISYPQPPDGRDSGSDSVNILGLQTRTDPNMGQSSEDMKPPLIPIKKEPPVFPPGSQEERWQLQIVAKGRVTCPKCKSVSRKTVDGLKKHMENCRLQPFTCQHCGKQLKSSTGMKYHMMADHSNLPSLDETTGLDDRAVKDQLRKVLKRLGKLKCSKDGCSAAFTSIMGYMYHMKKCGKEESELEKLLLNCSHCGKAYKSKAGLEYHLKSEHAPAPERNEAEEALKAQREANPERTASGRMQRASAQVANFHLAEIANNDLPKDWPKRKFQSDLVPDDKKLKYARPGLPAFSQEVLRKWKNEVKLQRRVQCPNQGCGCTYSSVSGLKAHLGLCTMGDFEAGKYRCLICNKEFNSESGVKYHINSVHSQDWFVTNKKASKKFEQFLRNQPREPVQGEPHHCPHVPHHHQHHQQPPHLQHQSSQQPLQPLHHLQHHAHFLHHHRHHQHHQMTPVTEMQELQPVLQYMPLEPPAAGPTWVDVDQGAGHAQAQTGTPAAAVPGGGEEAGRRRDKAGREEGRTYGGGASTCSSSSNTGSSSSESEVEQQERQKQA